MRGPAAPDPYILSEMPLSNHGAAYRDTVGLSYRGAINTAIRNLVLITCGQSNLENSMPTLYTPSNSTVVDQLNIYDGAIYNITGPLLGCPLSPLGQGNISVRLADTFVTNAKFDRVIVVPIAIGSTSVSDWAVGGTLFNRINVAVLRLAAIGITPQTNVTFATVWGQGENDTLAGTSQASYTASLSSFISNVQSILPAGKIFVIQESFNAGVTSAAVRAAQAAAVNGTTVFSGGDWDTLTTGDRQVDNTHFNDAGAALAATLTYNAMHASGVPY